MKVHVHSNSCKHSKPSSLPELTDKLRRDARRITGPRQAILQAMRQHTRPLAIKEIYSKLGTSHCDLVTVYRSMEMLCTMGMVKRVDLGKGGARFELISEGDDGHHHHLVCTQCDTVLPVEDCLLPRVDRNIAKASGFKSVTHRLEFFGLCPKCQ
jgi:Fur family transcriptional regulator, ferric uptake regulator